MAYGLRYTLTQILRNGNSQIVEVYQKDYIGDIKVYQPISIRLQPNSSVEYPYPTIISSQLNFSILLETNDDYEQFPNVLSQDDRLYYVLLKEDTTIMWRGFMFNDFSQMGYSTGITQADFVCVDGISYLQSMPYVRTQCINQLITHLSVITTALNNLVYPDNINLIVACSYFAEGMVNRADNVTNEPFSQIYQYPRDFMGLSYYDILNNIMTTFNCRLFQANGDWWICSMNEMALDVNYYTKYTLSPDAVLVNGGILNNTINIEPYADGNVHFINNSQNKILKKGFYNIQGRGTYESALNYCDNADLKINDGTNAEGFIKGSTGTGSTALTINADGQFDDMFLNAGTSGTASFENGNLIAPYYYLPYIGEVPFALTFDYIGSAGSKLQIILYTPVGTRYLDSNKIWQTTVQYITISDSSGGGNYSNYSIDIPPYKDVSGIQFGYLKFRITSNINGANIKLRNFIIQRGTSNVKYLEVNFNPFDSNSSTLKVFEQPYGNNYPTLFNYSINKGVLCNSSGEFLKVWYSSISTDYPAGAIDLVTWITYQNIRNLNKNIATLECDLGAFKADTGYIYLDKVFTTTDIITGNLSYEGKKFIINRLTQDAYNNEVTSIQLMEVSEGQILPEPWFLAPTYITDSGQLGPFWNFQFNIITS